MFGIITVAADCQKNWLVASKIKFSGKDLDYFLASLLCNQYAFIFMEIDISAQNSEILWFSYLCAWLLL